MSTGFVMMPQMIKSAGTELATATGRNLPAVVQSGSLANITKDCVTLSTKGGALKKAGKYGAIAAGVLAAGTFIASLFKKDASETKAAE